MLGVVRAELILLHNQSTDIVVKRIKRLCCVQPVMDQIGDCFLIVSQEKYSMNIYMDRNVVKSTTLKLAKY